MMKNKSFISQEEVYTVLQSYLVENHYISDECFNELCRRIVIKTAKKEEVVSAEGQICDHIFFVAQGFCFTYCIWEGKEYILDFFKEGTFALIFHSFFGHQSSFLNMKVSEHSTLAVLKHSDYIWLSNEYKDFRDVMCRIYTDSLIRLETIQRVFRCYTAEERINFFFKSHEIQFLMKHIPQYRIASWLNMAPETFAKIWGKINLP